MSEAEVSEVLDAAPAPAPKKEAKVTVADDLESELDNLLGDLDD